MAADDTHGPEVDRLVRELWTRKTPAAPVKPVPAPAASPAAVEPVEPAARVVRGSPFTTARILMPATHPGSRRSYAASISAPAWLRMPTLSDETIQILVVRAWVALGSILAVSMLYWPYPKTYLFGLLAYILAVGVVLLTGLWSAKLTWDARLGGAHTISLGIAFWAVVLVAIEVIPLTAGFAA